MGYKGEITSRQNQLINTYTKLKNKKSRDEMGLFFFEGKKLFVEAIENKANVKCVFVLESLKQFCEEYFKKYDFDYYVVNESVYQKLTNESSPEGIFTICQMTELKEKSDGIILILDSLQDPGNIGTIIRSADAFGCKRIICSNGCADIYSDKTIRASMGAIFRVSIKRERDIIKDITELKEAGYIVYASVLQKESEKLGNIKNFENTAFVIGNEGNGIRENVISACSKKVYIPMVQNSSESLNASVAASVILYKASENKLLEKKK